MKEVLFWHVIYRLSWPAAWTEAETLPTAIAMGREDLKDLGKCFSISLCWTPTPEPCSSVSFAIHRSVWTSLRLPTTQSFLKGIFWSLQGPFCPRVWARLSRWSTAKTLFAMSFQWPWGFGLCYEYWPRQDYSCTFSSGSAHLLLNLSFLRVEKRQDWIANNVLNCRRVSLFFFCSFQEASCSF